LVPRISSLSPISPRPHFPKTLNTRLVYGRRGILAARVVLGSRLSTAPTKEFFVNVYEGKNIRNVAVAGHGGSGKTSLISAALFISGATNRFGRVDDGNAPTDYDDEEIERKITISAKLAFAEWNKTKINLIDTPGFGYFIQEARGALRAVDAALIVVDAVSG